MIALNLTNLRDKLSMQFICWVFYAKLDEKLVTFNCKYCKKYTKKLIIRKSGIYKEVGWSPMYGIQIAPPQL